MSAKKGYKLKEPTYELANEKKCFEKRKSSQGCDLKVYIHGKNITCGTFTIPPKKNLGRMSAHSADETYYVTSGTLRVKLPRIDEDIEVKKGEVFYMPGGMIHQPYNNGDVDCVVLWHCAPEWP